MKNVFRVSVAWPSGVRPSGAPDLDTYEEAVQWIEEHPFRGNSGAAYEIKKLWVPVEEQTQ